MILCSTVVDASNKVEVENAEVRISWVGNRATGLERRACWLSDVSAGGRLDCLDPDYFSMKLHRKKSDSLVSRLVRLVRH